MAGPRPARRNVISPTCRCKFVPHHVIPAAPEAQELFCADSRHKRDPNEVLQQGLQHPIGAFAFETGFQCVATGLRGLSLAVTFSSTDATC
jgi:hypothetical protein